MTHSPTVRHDRIAERLKALGLSERAASMQATGRPDVLRFMRTRDTVPAASRMMKIASVLQADPEYLLGMTDSNDWEARKDVVAAAAKFPEQAIKDIEAGSRRVPVLDSTSTSAETSAHTSAQGQDHITLSALKGDVIGFAAGPQGRSTENLIAFYLNDPAMYPVFENNVPVVVDLEAKPIPGDFAIIWFGGDFKGSRIKPVNFLVRRLIDRSADWITVEQFSPSRLFRLQLSEVDTMAKVLSLREYVMP